MNWDNNIKFYDEIDLKAKSASCVFQFYKNLVDELQKNWMNEDLKKLYPITTALKKKSLFIK